MRTDGRRLVYKGSGSIFLCLPLSQANIGADRVLSDLFSFVVESPTPLESLRLTSLALWVTLAG